MIRQSVDIANRSNLDREGVTVGNSVRVLKITGSTL